MALNSRGLDGERRFGVREMLLLRGSLWASECHGCWRLAVARPRGPARAARRPPLGRAIAPGCAAALALSPPPLPLWTAGPDGWGDCASRVVLTPTGAGSAQAGGAGARHAVSAARSVAALLVEQAPGGRSPPSDAAHAHSWCAPCPTAPQAAPLSRRRAPGARWCSRRAPCSPSRRRPRPASTRGPSCSTGRCCTASPRSGSRSSRA